MKHTNPKFLAERARLKLKLALCEQRIQDDIEVLKQAARPIALAKSVINQAADTFRDNSVATQGMRLALTLFPRRFRHPVVGIAAQIAVPLLLRNLPSILNFAARKTGDFKQTALGEKLGNIWDRVRGR